MSTTWSHVFNCELYKVLAIKVDELRSMVTGEDDIDELRSENNILCSMLTIFKDARAQAEFKIIKSEMIQRLSLSAQKQAKLKIDNIHKLVDAKVGFEPTTTFGSEREENLKRVEGDEEGGRKLEMK
ncbi:Uncharacterized protein Fot_11721 [Forsythia ovata]|uniref:Uncharacterized protein n=1 Tax=Forsythia ovata TaxID=205694 RepID=A0ABD1WKW2_9LAMI